MFRFWMFPLLLGATGAGMFCFGAAQYIPADWLTLRRSLPDAVNDFGIFMVKLFPGAAAVAVPLGIVLGLVLATVDWYLHKSRDYDGWDTGSRLLQNLLWSTVYMQALMAFSIVVGGSLFRVLGSPLIRVFVYLPILFLPVAYLWAAIRTVISEEVLSPDVLKERFGR